MATVRTMPEGVDMMLENRFALAGWLSLVAAIIFPVSFVLGVLETAVLDEAFGYEGPIVGPSDGISVIFVLLTVYVLVMFRRYLHERYDYRGIDGLISLSIAWNIIFEVSSLVAGAFLMLVWPIHEGSVIVAGLGVLGLFMLTAGIINLLIGLRLLQSREDFSELLRVYGVLMLLAGIFQVSLLLSPLALFLVPVLHVLLCLILLREKTEAEFV